MLAGIPFRAGADEAGTGPEKVLLIVDADRETGAARDEIARTVTARLREGKVSVETAGDGKGCREPGCAGPGARQAGAGAALVVAWAREGRSVDLRLCLVDAASSDIRWERRAVCPLCTLEEGLELLRDTVSRSFPFLHAPAPAEIRILSPETLTAVALDGDQAGLTPVTAVVPAGKHTIEAVAPGLKGRHEIELVPDERREILLSMSPIKKEEGLSTYEKWAIFFGATAVAGIVGGALFMSYDGTCIRDEDPCTTDVSNLWPAGTASFVLAGASMGAAALLYFLEPETKEGKAP